MVWSVIAFGGIWFWLTALVATLILIGLIEDDRPGGAFCVIAGWLLLVHIFGDTNFYSPVIDNPVKTLVYAGIYLLIGFGWSFVRVMVWARKNKAEQLRQWEYTQERATRSNRNNEFVFVQPSFSNIRDRITVWIAYWPWSMFWTLLRDIILDIIEIVVDSLRAVYAFVLEKFWGKLPEDYVKHREKMEREGRLED